MGVGVHLILLETAKLFPRAAEVFCAPTSNVWEFQLLHIFANTSVIPFNSLSAYRDAEHSSLLQEVPHIFK